MGYRSDVRILIRKKDYYKLKKISLEKFGKAHSLMEKNNFDCFKDYGTWVKFGWNYLKWYYPDYENVKLIQDFVTCETKSFQFVRIGEEIGDVEDICELDWGKGQPDAINIIQCFDDE